MRKFYFFIFLTLFSQNLLASSCCGGGSSSSMIIIGDNKTEMGTGFSFRRDLGQTDSEGYSSFHGDKIKDDQLALSLQYQRILAEQFQAAIKTSFIQKQIEKQGRKETKNGLGDFELQSSYEFLPEYTYSAYKPRGFIYTKATIPNSKSLYDSSSALFSDVRGSGLYSLGLGTFFIKRISSFTLKAGNEVQYFFGKTFNNTTLDDYYKVLLPLGLTYSIDPLPINLGINSTWNYQSEKKLTGAIESTSSKEYFWEIGTFINWTINREDSMGLSYTDSTLVGKSINSSLYRSVALSYTHALPL